MTRQVVKKSSYRKKLMLVIAALLLISGLVYGLVIRPKQATKQISPPQPPIKQQDINFQPPTPSDQAAADANKQKVTDQITQDQQPPASGQKTVSPVITSPVPPPNTNPRELRIAAYVPEVFEDGGTCTATIQGAKVVKQTSKGFKNVSTTSCVPMNTSLSAGTWTLVVAYESATAKGQSNSMTFKVE